MDLTPVEGVFLKGVGGLTLTLVLDAEDSDDEDKPDDATVRTTNAVADHFPFNTVDTAKPVTVEDPILPEDQAEFLRLHERMGHSSFHLL